MHTAATIIPRPPVISKYFSASIVVLLCASAPLPHLDRYYLRDGLPNALPRKEQPENLPKNQLFRQQRHRYRKNQARHHRHECDHHLHNAPSTTWHRRANTNQDGTGNQGLTERTNRLMSGKRRALCPNRHVVKVWECR